ncbi:MAG: epoxyqueuosine reductase QueH [Syntrophomonadaceae bacterium]|nr:epoxyqueuosine reductase QueH [Syntrophomonadaceae bacterium]
MPKVLLHICCGPCATYPVPELIGQGFEVMGFFSNSNIHPYTEYLKRREGVEAYADSIGLSVIYDDNYDPSEYFQLITHREKQRCNYCYIMRLEKAAQIARRGKFDYFSTTLLVSPMQKHELIRELGEAIGEKYNVPFLYHDFRPGFKETVSRSREMGLYRQQYCGCLYSEKERYTMKSPKDKPTSRETAR